tara:strand:+ start:2336 stop:2836 length:501 start_codon:yes stop_codon:yes gene_type:complete
MYFDRLSSENSNKKENIINTNMLRENSDFLGNESNLDIKQNISIQKNLKKTIENTDLELNKKNYESVNDSLNYLECLNGTCSKINNNTNNKIKKNYFNNNNDITSSTNKSNKIIELLDILISLIYIISLVILLVISVIKKDSNSLIYVLIITLIYLFYKIFISNKN